MQQLYVVGLEVTLADGCSAPSAFERLMAHMEQHVSPVASGVSTAELMSGKGEVVIPGYGQGRPDQHVSWLPVTVADGVRALRMDIGQDLPKGGRFLCQLTASEYGGTTGFRVVMGRESGGLLAPATVEELRPPRSLNSVMQDSGLRCADGLDVITARENSTLTSQLPSVRDHLFSPGRRLPVLLISSIRTVGPPAVFARKAARRLAGLAHVVVVSGWLAFDSFNAGLERNLLPRDGARLYWPTVEARAPWWGSADLYGDHDALLGKLTRLLAPLSVVARGRDRLWEAVRSAETDALLDDLAGTESEQIDLLKDKLEEERGHLVQLLEQNELLENQVARLEIESANLTAQLEMATLPTVTEPTDVRRQPIANPDDFSADWDRWTEESEGALVFTPHAKDQWGKCEYPYPERMREALDTLSDLAREWRKQRGKLGTSLVSWIGDRTPLVYAPQDEALYRKKLHEFKFERTKSWDRQPHIKLDDYTTPDRVGRIYFAIDGDKYRWIVDHVGLKLYGL
ncbi:MULTISPECIES: hypothetical protein [Streptomyces]|uniref:Uncharacterized protein n=1 Tax=Streptomyces glycanivorans TaxID=3033808 RepID=A0ABY9J8T0_9ACTN|nr:hypothetical protein [Streptomyces sp. Alt3]WLQ64237.1 hypothetical protein P8A20_11820 [Streptomyces sp. Alt3]